MECRIPRAAESDAVAAAELALWLAYHEPVLARGLEALEQTAKGWELSPWPRGPFSVRATGRRPCPPTGCRITSRWPTGTPSRTGWYG